MTYLYSLRGTNLLITQLLTICIKGLPSSTISPKSQPPRKPPYFRPQKITLPPTFKKVKEEKDFKNPDTADVNLQMFASLADTRHKHVNQPRNSRQSVPHRDCRPTISFFFSFPTDPYRCCEITIACPLGCHRIFFPRFVGIFKVPVIVAAQLSDRFPLGGCVSKQYTWFYLEEKNTTACTLSPLVAV